ncbi:hypothetical protein CLV78_101488 [Aliiruegeria haliotis]|uniref:Uncharacterized protein n=1 Tax=Aliiruegeria haliotis TaxID=1280846 RepID=A0A2T0RZC6_9RHOB|nr:hypothetical protein [Aliiruegeria haliotis]PRY26393.1 hypothetical protein CLV78_101488 [Aliiruegeria haliotis]
MSAPRNREPLYRIDGAMDVLVPRRAAPGQTDPRTLAGDIGTARQDSRRAPDWHRTLRPAQAI